MTARNESNDLIRTYCQPSKVQTMKRTFLDSL